MTLAADWTGQTGDTWAREWRRTDRSFAGLVPHLDAAILAAAPEQGFRALDIGCGAGATACALAVARRDAEVVGVDLSAELVAVARGRALGNTRFLIGDAVATAAAQAPIDLYVSRHGVMFFDDPAAAFAGFARAAAPGARLVFSCFAERRANRFAADLLNALAADGEASTDATPGPFAFADPNRVAAILAAAGWVGQATHIDFAYRAGEGVDPVADAVDYFSRIGPAAPLLREAADRDAAVAAVATACAARLQDGVVAFPAAAWIWIATLRRSAL